MYIVQHLGLSLFQVLHFLLGPLSLSSLRSFSSGDALLVHTVTIAIELRLQSRDPHHIRVQLLLYDVMLTFRFFQLGLSIGVLRLKCFDLMRRT